MYTHNLGFSIVKGMNLFVEFNPNVIFSTWATTKVVDSTCKWETRKKSYLRSSTITTFSKICISFLEIIMSTCLQYVQKDDNGRHLFACMIHEVHFLMQLVQTHLILHHGSSYIHLCEQNEIIKYLQCQQVECKHNGETIGLLMFERGKNKSTKAILLKQNET